MTTSGKTFLQQTQDNPITQLSTGAKNGAVSNPLNAASDFSSKVASKVQEIKDSKVKTEATQPTKIENPTSWSGYGQLVEQKKQIRVEQEQEGRKAIGTLLREGVSYLQTGKSYEKNQEVAKQKMEEDKEQVVGILENQTTANEKRQSMYAATDSYDEKKYGPYVDYSRLRASVGDIGEIFKDVTVNAEGDTAYLTNGKTTISKPVIRTPDFMGVLQDAYNTVTHEYAAYGNVFSVEQLRQLYPEWDSASDEEINRFINECAYDVENNQRRDINMYAENFLDLSMTDGYTSKHDSILNLYSDKNYINYGLGDFIIGNATLDDKTPEQIGKYVAAVEVIKDKVEKIKQEGANTQGASDYVIAKTFAKQDPELKAALETYNSFNLTQKDLLQIDGQYVARMSDYESFRNDMSEDGKNYEKMLREYTDQVIKDFLRNESYWGEIVQKKQELYGKVAEKIGYEETTLLKYATFPLITIPYDILFGSTYYNNGKYYDQYGNEITKDSERVGLVMNLIEGFADVSRKRDEYTIDMDALIQASPEDENYRELATLPNLDVVNLAFSALMNFTGEGIVFQGIMNEPILGPYIEGTFNRVLSGIGEKAMRLADAIGYTEGWSESGKQKFEEAASGLGMMVLGRFKNKALKKVKDSVLVKSIRAWSKELSKNLEIIDKSLDKEKEKFKEGIDKEAPEKQIKEQEKIIDETIEKEKETRKAEFKRDAFRNAWNSFRETFESEMAKEKESTTSKPTIVDTLFEKAVSLGERLKGERATEVKNEVNKIEQKEVQNSEKIQQGQEELQTPEREQTVPTETAEQTPPQEGVETPEVAVEQVTKEGEKATGKAEVKEESEGDKTRKEIKGILGLIAQMMDIARNVTSDLLTQANEGITKARNSYRSRKEWNDIRDNEVIRAKRREIFREAGIPEDVIDLMENNPFTDTILELADQQVEVTEQGGKKTVLRKKELSQDTLQREVVSEGIKKIQQHYDKIKSAMTEIGKYYQKLSTERNVDTSEFHKQPAFQEYLDNLGFKARRVENPETGEVSWEVSNKDGSLMRTAEEKIARDIESLLNELESRPMASEKDLNAIKDHLKNGWTSKGDKKISYEGAVDRQLYGIFNEFIKSRPETEMLEKLDSAYSDALDQLSIISDLMDPKKPGEAKENAKNKLIKMSDAELDQLNEILPGVKDIVELAKNSSKIVNAVVDAKMTYEKTHKLAGAMVKRLFLTVGLSAAASYITGGFWQAIKFSIFAWIGNKAASKIVGKKVNWKAYNEFVDALKVDDNTKAKFKQELLKSINEQESLLNGKSQAEVDAILDEVIDILAKREGEKQLKEEQRQREIKQRQQQEVTSFWDRFNNRVDEGAKTPKLGQREGYGEEYSEPIVSDEKGNSRRLSKKDVKEEDLRTEENKSNGYLTPDVTKSAAILSTPKEYSETAIKIADSIENTQKTLESALEEQAINKIEERGEEPTVENIKNEVENPTPAPKVESQSISDFISEMTNPEGGEPTPEEIDYSKVSLSTLYKLHEDPKYAGDALEIEKVIMQKEYESTNSDSEYDTNKKYIREKIQKFENRTKETGEESSRDAEKESIKKEIEQLFKVDTNEANDMYNELAGSNEGEKKLRVNSAEEDIARASLGINKSETVNRTSTTEKIASVKNPAKRKRLATLKLENTNKKLTTAKTIKAQDKLRTEIENLSNIIAGADEQLAVMNEVKANQKKIKKQYKENQEKLQNTESKAEKKRLSKENQQLAKEYDKEEKKARDTVDDYEGKLPIPREPTEYFYHASDSDIDIFDLDKTKAEGNGIGLAVNLMEDHPYTDKPYQYKIKGSNFKIGGADTLLNMNILKKICKKLGIELEEAWGQVELPELSNIIAEESGKGNKEVTKVLVEETGLDGVDTHHGYTVLWNEEKINNMVEKTEKKGIEAPKENEQPEIEKEEFKPLVKFDANKKPYELVGNPTATEIYDRMQEIRDKAKANGNKIGYNDRMELEYLKDAYKRKLEDESREEYNPTEEEENRMFERMQIQGSTISTTGISGISSD